MDDTDRLIANTIHHRQRDRKHIGANSVIKRDVLNVRGPNAFIIGALPPWGVAVGVEHVRSQTCDEAAGGVGQKESLSRGTDDLRKRLVKITVGARVVLVEQGGQLASYDGFDQGPVLGLPLRRIRSQECPQLVL